MRVIIYGTGAVGGVLAAAFARSGTETIAIARGTMLEAIRDKGLRLRSPELDVTVPLTTAASPAEIDFRPDDAILLCMKTQDTMPALEALRDAGVSEQPIFCFQNGLENERMALRLFPHVHGAMVILPGTFLVPGEVATHARPRFGLFDIGRYPEGLDEADSALAKALEAANFAVVMKPRVMEAKRGKLLLNLGNVLDAAFGSGAEDGPIRKAMRAEAEACFAAAGLGWDDVGPNDPRRAEHVQIVPIEGVLEATSTRQSLMRGGSVETDYLNGEIVLMGRELGVATPVNEAMIALAARMVREGKPAGSADPAAVIAALSLG